MEEHFDKIEKGISDLTEIVIAIKNRMEPMEERAATKQDLSELGS